jgi:hypothetical protein
MRKKVQYDCTKMAIMSLKRSVEKSNRWIKVSSSSISHLLFQLELLKKENEKSQTDKLCGHSWCKTIHNFHETIQLPKILDQV